MHSYTKMWIVEHGPLPKNHEITHLDGDHKNNKFSNLAINGLTISAVSK